MYAACGSQRGSELGGPDCKLLVSNTNNFYIRMYLYIFIYIYLYICTYASDHVFLIKLQCVRLVCGIAFQLRCRFFVHCTQTHSHTHTLPNDYLHFFTYTWLI